MPMLTQTPVAHCAQRARAPPGPTLTGLLAGEVVALIVMSYCLTDMLFAARKHHDIVCQVFIIGLLS